MRNQEIEFLESDILSEDNFDNTDSYHNHIDDVITTSRRRRPISVSTSYDIICTDKRSNFYYADNYHNNF